MCKDGYALPDMSEHLSCGCYSPNGDSPLIETVNIPEGGTVKRQCEKFKIVFIRSGKVTLSRMGFNDEMISRGKLFLLSPGTLMSISAIQEAHLVVCRLHNTIRYCQKVSMEGLKGHLCSEDISIPARLPLTRYMENLAACLDDGFRCKAYLTAKQTELMYLFRAYYTRKELAAFFRPLLGNDVAFRVQVLNLVGQERNVAEIAEECRMSRQGFTKRFKREFGSNPKEYLLERKKDQIISELQNKSRSITQIAETLGFTSANALAKFSHHFLGDSPTEIRNKQARLIAGSEKKSQKR